MQLRRRVTEGTEFMDRESQIDSFHDAYERAPAGQAGWRVMVVGGDRFLATPLLGDCSPIQLRHLSLGDRSLVWIDSGRLREGSHSGLIESGGSIYLTIALPKGEEIEELLPIEPPTMELLNSIVDALIVLESSDDPIAETLLSNPLQPEGVISTGDGKVILLGRESTSRLQPLISTDCSHNWVEHPGLSGKRALLFSIALLTYRCLTGEFPYRGEREELKGRIIGGVFTPIAAHLPTITPGLEEWIHRSLRGEPGSGRGEIARLKRLLAERSSSTTAEKIANRRVQGIKQEKRREQFHLLLKKLCRRQTRIAVAAGVTLLLAAAGGLIGKKVLSPPITVGWSQERVVREYYRGINQLDSSLLDNLTSGSAGRERRDQVLQLFAITRIRLSVEGVSPYVDGETWLSTGSKLLPGQLLYGVSDIDIERVGENKLTVTYREWYSQPTERGSEEQQEVVGKLVVEEVVLSLQRGGWLIVETEIVESSLLSDLETHQ